MERDAEPLATSMTIKKPQAIGYVKQEPLSKWKM